MISAMALLVWASALNVPHTFVAGEVISAAEMNANFDAIAAAVAALEATAAAPKPTTSAVRSDLTVASGSAPWVPFDYAPVTTGGMFSPAEPTRVTISVDGLYLVAARVNWSTNEVGRRSATVYANQLVVMSDQRLASGPSSNSVSGVHMLSAGDYVELRLFQDSGVDINANRAVLDVSWLGPAP